MHVVLPVFVVSFYRRILNDILLFPFLFNVIQYIDSLCYRRGLCRIFSFMQSS